MVARRLILGQPQLGVVLDQGARRLHLDFGPHSGTGCGVRRLDDDAMGLGRVHRIGQTIFQLSTVLGPGGIGDALDKLAEQVNDQQTERGHF